MKYILCSDWLPSVARWGLAVLIPRRKKTHETYSQKFDTFEYNLQVNYKSRSQLQVAIASYKSRSRRQN